MQMITEVDFSELDFTESTEHVNESSQYVGELAKRIVSETTGYRYQG